MASTPLTEGSGGPATKSLVASLLSFLASNSLIILPALFITRLIYIRYASPLRKYPGPLLASVSRLWKVLSTASGRTHLEHIALHHKYGPVVRIAPNEVSIASPEAARTVLSAGKHFYKTKFYGVFPPPENPDIFTEVREHVHAQKKKVANVPYSMAAMQQLSPFIDESIEMFMNKLDGFASRERGGNGQVDLGAWLHYFAFDVLGEVAFGRKFGFLEEGRDVENAIKTIDDSQWYNGIVGQIPEFDYLFRRNPLRKLIPTMSTKNALVTRLALAEMDRRQPFTKDNMGKDRVGDGRQDLLASLIQGHLKDPSKFSEGDVFAVAHGAIFAGSDSTASTMQSFFWLALSDPRVRRTLFDEIRTAVAEGRIPAHGNLTWAQSQSLTYFQACLKEAMRIRPAVGLNITRVVPPEGAELDGISLEGGTVVAVNGWVLHRDKATFGQDADVYRPERWLQDEETARRMERYMFQFGGGAHVCIGRNLALLEINKVVPRILRDFDLELVNPSQPLRANATFFVVQEGLDVYIKSRSK
ncbi:hypothetical protein SAPIO_CDS9109 [Scedosporium apiospermum]|uniref:Cytochrome P450 oxidoreductase n=1 Tax=Pseudallescheria apiosperma TaxID=563466 RepID=A0A084FYD3_PSEDA|nr:uncharacterized protein SAPIO_CDS9109 [Scedosporium apiospermum]KEZ40095.1 hypothetical protein SAPIO_CDS9109 [Scedosporium apiospermum]